MSKLIGIFCVAKINEQAINAKQRSLVKRICDSGFVSFFLTAGIRSAATAEADIIITLDSHSYHKDYIIAKEEPISMHFVANPKSNFAGIKNLSIKDIINEPFVLTEYGQGYRRVFDKELAKKSLEITPILEIGRTDMITSLIAKDDVLSFLPDFVTKEMVESGNLCYLDVCDINVEIWKQLIYHKNKWLSKSLKILLDYIIKKNFSH